MTVWDNIKKILHSEGADLKEGLDEVRDKLDGFLTEKEREQAATPKERMDMISDDMASTEDEFDRIIDKAEGRRDKQTAESELRDALGGSANPAATSSTTAQAASSPSGSPTSGRVPTSVSDTDLSPEAAADRTPAEKTAAEKAAEQEAKRLAARNAADAKFEEQKAKAGDLLDELRGELGIDDGEKP